MHLAAKKQIIVQTASFSQYRRPFNSLMPTYHLPIKVYSKFYLTFTKF